MTDKVKCSNCDHCILEDFGYSNWTVEGTTVHCVKGLNPNGEFDRWYGEDEKDKFAEKCPSFSSEVGPVIIDCEMGGANYGADDPEEKWRKYSTDCISGQDIEELLNG